MTPTAEPVLDPSQVTVLRRLAARARKVPIEKLLRRTEEHLAATHRAHDHNPLINVDLAAAIVEVCRRLVADWETLPADARPWLRGAFSYFVRSGDEEPDFESLIGFEDDAEVLNACLRLAGREALCIRIEDFDQL